MGAEHRFGVLVFGGYLLEINVRVVLWFGRSDHLLRVGGWVGPVIPGRTGRG
jgi:hypothetical protein